MDYFKNNIKIDALTARHMTSSRIKKQYINYDSHKFNIKPDLEITHRDIPICGEQEAIYIHPTGAVHWTKNVSESMIYEECFGGTVIMLDLMRAYEKMDIDGINQNLKQKASELQQQDVDNRYRNEKYAQQIKESFLDYSKSDGQRHYLDHWATEKWDNINNFIVYEDNKLSRMSYVDIIKEYGLFIQTGYGFPNEYDTSYTYNQLYLSRFKGVDTKGIQLYNPMIPFIKQCDIHETLRKGNYLRYIDLDISDNKPYILFKNPTYFDSILSHKAIRSVKMGIKPKQVFDTLKTLPNVRLTTDDLNSDKIEKRHPELYKAQDKVLNKLQESDGFHLLAGEVGVGKTHIASSYINDYLKDNPNAKILIVEPVKEVIPKFEQLIKTDKITTSNKAKDMDNSNIIIQTDGRNINKYDWDLIVFDEFHKMDKSKTISRYPLDNVNNLPKNVLAMTGTVSNTSPNQVWSVSKNWTAAYDSHSADTIGKMLACGPYNNKNIPQYTRMSAIPETYVSIVLKDSMVSLLRSDIKELNIKADMKVNKKAVGLDLTPIDKAFYNMMTIRADNLKMDTKSRLDVLNKAFNSEQTEFIVQPVNKSYKLVNPKEIKDGHDLLYLGKHDQPFIDRKIDLIDKIVHDKKDKVLVYLTSNEFGERITKDCMTNGINAEFVDTTKPGAVNKINSSDANVVIFDVNPIQEGVDLNANTVIWYDTPQTAGLDEQACGRITRLSSEKIEKNIYYLYHKTTIQEEITQNIIRTNEINNFALNRDNYTVDNIDELQL